MPDTTTGLATTESIEHFAAHLVAGAHRLASAREWSFRSYRFGPLSMRIAFSSSGIERRLGRAIKHADVAVERSDFDVVALDGSDPDLPDTPEWTFPVTRASHRERLHMADDGSIVVNHDPDRGIWQVLDRRTRCGLYWCASAGALPHWEDGSPFRTLIHWWTIPTRLAVTHAASLTDGKCGALLAGRGGSGKSTTTAAAMLAGLASAGDDLVLLDGCERSGFVAHAVFDTVKLDEAALGRVDGLAIDAAANREKASDEKARFHLSTVMADRFVSALPVHAILLPQITGSAATEIVPSSAGRAMIALAPSTLFLMRGGAAETAAKTARLARSLPVFDLRLGVNTAEVAETLVRWMTRA